MSEYGAGDAEVDKNAATEHREAASDLDTGEGDQNAGGGGRAPQAPAKSDPSPVDNLGLGTAASRLLVGRDLLALGFVLVFASFALALLLIRSVTDVVAVLAPITTLVGSLIGAAFGVQAGNERAAAESAQRARAQDDTVTAAALLDPEQAKEFLMARSNSTDNGNPPDDPRNF